MPAKISTNLNDNLGRLDEAIIFHNLSDSLTIDDSQMIPVVTKKKMTAAEERKMALVRSLGNELLFLGLKEGNVVECHDIENVNHNEIEYRGTIRKRIKNGLIMEYSFSSLNEGIRNFHLNNVEIELETIPEDKLTKLYIITRFFNSIYRKKEEAKTSTSDLTAAELEKRRQEREKEQKRRLVLGKL